MILRKIGGACTGSGLGEFTDSLLLDPFTELSRLLVPYFAKTPNAVLELKTKTNFVENLRGLDHGGHTIIAWSLNSGEIRKKRNLLQPPSPSGSRPPASVRSGLFPGVPFRPDHRLSPVEIGLCAGPWIDSSAKSTRPESSGSALGLSGSCPN